VVAISDLLIKQFKRSEIFLDLYSRKNPESEKCRKTAYMKIEDQIKEIMHYEFVP
jgi:hypothetical protein